MNFSDTFSQSRLFAGIEKDKISGIFRFGHRLGYESGAVLFHEGDPALRCYLLVKGRLKLSKLHEDGKEAIVRYITPGEMTAHPRLAVNMLQGAVERLEDKA